jgi:hypothetical protein
MFHNCFQLIYNITGLKYKMFIQIKRYESYNLVFVNKTAKFVNDCDVFYICRRTAQVAGTCLPAGRLVAETCIACY